MPMSEFIAIQMIKERMKQHKTAWVGLPYMDTYEHMRVLKAVEGNTQFFMRLMVACPIRWGMNAHDWPHLDLLGLNICPIIHCAFPGPHWMFQHYPFLKVAFTFGLRLRVDEMYWGSTGYGYVHVSSDHFICPICIKRNRLVS